MVNKRINKNERDKIIHLVKIHTMEGAAETYSSMEKRLRELEDRMEKLEKKKPATAATARKSTVASLDEKMNTILDILAKVVVPTAAARDDNFL